MRLLTIIVTCDLPGYLGNLLRSLHTLFPVGDTLVVDNGHDGAQTQSVIWREMPNAYYLGRQSNRTDRKVGSLYEAYNSAIEFGLQQKYEFLHFVQDDMQWMWYQPGILARIANVLDHYPTISMIMP